MWTRRRSWIFLGTGFAMGLLVGIGMLIGAMVAQHRTAPPLTFPEHLLGATATHGSDSFAIATGPVADGVEGVFVLDYLTGELQCSVINPRNGQLGGMFRANVMQDLGVQPDKTPHYLMVTGMANFRVAGQNVRPADSVVYVLDSNTGNFAAYMLPWNRAASNWNVTQVSPMVLLGTGSARNIELRD